LESPVGAQGVNLFNCSGVAAWQSVFHFHMHVIPRYRDSGKDRMELPFQPGPPADTEAIAERAKILAASLRGIA
jgi:histidine triad (HIT) family protein